MRRRDEGYTLLEMLVALVVFGLLMAGIVQSYRFGLTVWSAGPAKETDPENMAAVDAALARMIEAARPGSLRGDSTEAAFTTRLPEGAGLPGLADAAILLAPDGTLVLRYRAHPPGVPLAPLAPPATEPLIRNVTGFSIAYLAPQPNAPPVWAESWAGRRPPLLLRLHVTLAGGRSWPDLIAGPVDQDPGPPGGN